MKQAVQNLRGQVKLLDVPIPALRDGGVLVRTAASVISPGTERANVERSRRSLLTRARERPDLVRQVLKRVRQEGLGAAFRSVNERLEEWIPMGYSSAGIVEAVGAGVEGLKVGDLVACAGGGYAVHAEWAWIPERLVAKVPEGVTPGSAAFATLGAIALQGVRQADPRLGECVAVIGLGLLGQLTVQLLVANGCTVLATDLDEARRGLALTGGAVAVSAPDESFEALVTRVTGGRGADAVIITASTDSEGPIRQAGRISRDRGRVVVVGAVPVNVPRSPYYEKEVDVRFSRSYGPGRYDPTYEEGGHDYPIGYVRWTEQRNLEACLDLMSNGRLDVAPLISHRFPVEAAERAYEALTGAAPGLGILLEYDVAAPAAMPSTPAAPRGFVPGRLGVALVGPGAFAKNVLLPAIRAVPGVELRVAVAATGLSAQNMVERAGFAAASTNFDEMLADPTVDVVFISTRHHLHASQVVAGLRAGKHVFVEKPLCLTEEELDRIAAEYTAVGGGSGGGPLLMVGFNRRFAPLIEALTPLFAPRRRGLHIHYRVNAGQVPPTHWVHDPAVGGGRILGEGCHFIDTIASIAGADPARVMAAASGSDNCSAVITLADGSEATFQYISSGHPDVPKEYIEVMGEGVVAQIDDFRTLRAWTTQGERVSRLPAQDKGHRAEVAAFLDAVRRGGPAPIPAASLYSTTRATIRLVESAATGMPLDVSVRALRGDAV